MLPRLKGLDHEEFWVILLNRANYIIHKEMISLGGISSTVVDSKLVVRMALDKRASGLIMVHNHPSGNPRPGHNDLTETERMKKRRTLSTSPSLTTSSSVTTAISVSLTTK